MGLRPDERVRLKRRINRKVDVLITPEKPWDLPDYVQGVVEVAVASSPPVFMGRRLIRMGDRQLGRHLLVDDEAAPAPEFIDAEAESTSRSKSSEIGESGDSSGEEDGSSSAKEDEE